MKLYSALLWLALFVAVVAPAEAADAQIAEPLLRGLRDSETRKLLVDGVTGFRLIDSDSNLPVADLTDGTVVDLKALGKTEPNFNIEAVVSEVFEVIGSVKFAYNGAAGRTESIPPYAFWCVRELQYHQTR